MPGRFGLGGACCGAGFFLAGLGGGSLDPSGILDGMPPQPMAAPRSAAELFAPMPAASAAGGARPRATCSAVAGGAHHRRLAER